METVIYALRVKGQNSKYLRSFRRGSRPTYFGEATYWKKRKQALDIAKRYEIDRLCGKDYLELELVTYEVKPVERMNERIVVPAVELAVERVTRDFGPDVGNAYRCMVAQEAEDEQAVRQYKYAFRWRGAGKALIAEGLPSAITYGAVAIVKDDTELVYGRMLLGAGLTQHYDLSGAFLEEEPLGVVVA